MSFNPDTRVYRPSVTPLYAPTCKPAYNAMDPEEVSAMARTLSQDEATQVAQYVLSREGHRADPPGIQTSPEEKAAAMGSRILSKMAYIANQKRQTGQSVQSLVEQDRNTVYVGSCFSLKDQGAAFLDMVKDPMKVFEFGKGVYEKDPVAISKFLLEWQWTAHNTDTSAKDKPAPPAAAYQGNYLPYATPPNAVYPAPNPYPAAPYPANYRSATSYASAG